MISGATEGGAALPEQAVAPEGSATSDPLVTNGLRSPLCNAPAGELSEALTENCRTAEFVPSGAPTSHYAFDVQIETGLLGLGSGGISAAIQDVLVMPVWMVLVWIVHGLIVGLEWCFTVDLLDRPTVSQLGRVLRATQANFTTPWLVLMLAIAGTLAAYHGLVRRQVAETLGQALLMLAMMAGGLWVIADPAGTVGALADWADGASLGTFGAVAKGTPDGALGTLASGMSEIFAVTIEPAWCYMEFGNVGWCRDRSRLDPGLHAVALRIARELEAEPNTEAGGQSAELLRAARTNGQIFLALPANGALRNSITSSTSLLATLCGNSDLGECHGPAAAEAEFRTAGSTISRAAGLVLIAAGLIGMVLVLGFLALRLLEAAIMTLLYLLMAPAAILAPALGDGGRTAFRAWAGRLLGAATAKLLYAFLLGALLLVARVLAGVEMLGWWIQWLLISGLWWSAFRHRHRMVAFGPSSSLRSRQQASVRPASVRRVVTSFGSPRRLLRRADAAVDRVVWPEGESRGRAPELKGADE